MSPQSKDTVTLVSTSQLYTEFIVFKWLDTLRATAPGRDNLPHWFLRLAACWLAKPIAHIYNMSVYTSIVPLQWKEAVITPIPKVPNPLNCSDFRPISLTVPCT